MTEAYQMAAPKGRIRPTEERLTNEQVALLAVAALGGQYRPIDTEDAAIKADEIAPGRFRWRKHRQFINNELVHTTLRAAKRLGGFLSGSGSKGWQLTPRGQELVTTLERQGTVTTPARPSLTPRERTWTNRERSRLIAEDAYRKFVNGELDFVSRQEAERFFRVDEYVVGDARTMRLQRIRNAFGNDPDLGPLIEALIPRIDGR